MTINKENLAKLKKDTLVATAMQYGVDISQVSKKEDIAGLIMNKLQTLELPQQKQNDGKYVRPKPKMASEEEIETYLKSIEETGISVSFSEDEPGIVYLKKGRRETCVNINQPLNSIKRVVNIFSVNLGAPVEAYLAR